MLDTTTGEIDLFAEAEAQEALTLAEETPAERESRERFLAECREALGIPATDYLTIETEEDLHKRLRQRLHIVAEITEAKRHLATIEKQLKAWTTLYESQCEAYYQLNPPKKTKTLSTPYGKLSSRSVPESISLDPNDRDEAALQAWLKDQEEKHEEWGVKPVTKLTRDIDKVKTFLMAEYNKARDAWFATKPKQPRHGDMAKWAQQEPAIQLPPGLRYSPARESFSIKQGE